MSVEAVGYRTTVDVKSPQSDFTKELDDVIVHHEPERTPSGNSTARTNTGPTTGSTHDSGVSETAFDNKGFSHDEDSSHLNNNRTYMSNSMPPDHDSIKKPPDLENNSVHSTDRHQSRDKGNRASKDSNKNDNNNDDDDDDDEDDEDEDDDDDDDDEPAAGIVHTVQKFVYRTLSENSSRISYLIKVLVVVGYIVYFGFALDHEFGDEGSWRLVIVTGIVVFLLLLNVIRNRFSDSLENVDRSCTNFFEWANRYHFNRILKWALYLGVTIFMAAYLIVEVFIDKPEHLASLGGVAAFLILLYVTSSNPAKVDWHPVFWGLSMQYIFALMILRTTWGRDAFQYFGDRVTEFLGHTSAGSDFVLSTDTLLKHDIRIFAFNVLPIVIFVGSMTSVLFYLGAVQVVVKYIGRFLSFCLGTSAAESLNAAANIFLGMTESPLIIKNYIKDMTKSEIHAVMTGGFATIAGSVLGAYISMGISAKHLLSASVMSAPAALAMSKLACPETNHKKIAKNQDFSRIAPSTDRNIIEAAATGAMFTIQLVANIAFNLIAFIAILDFVNATLTWFGDRVGIDNFTFEYIASYLLYPVAMFMGTDLVDCKKIAELVGVKTFTNEFVAYDRLHIILNNKAKFTNYTAQYNESSDWSWVGSDIYLQHNSTTLKYGVLFQDKSVLIATYALCGFANFGSIGITLGGMSVLAPKRKALLSRIVIRAMIAGNVACFLTACIAGMLYED